MSFDENLGKRILDQLSKRKGTSFKKMFGGLCFLLNGNMLCGVVRKKLMVRIGPQAYSQALKQKYARPMNFTGRPLKGMVYVLPEGIRTKASLGKWIRHSLTFVELLPKKRK